MKRWSVLSLVLGGLVATVFGTAAGSTAVSSLATGVGNVPQGTQSNTSYAGSFVTASVTNVFATTAKVSCYRPEVSATAFDDGPNDGYSGESACPGATTGENTGEAAPYPTQAGSNPGYPMDGPQLVKDHSESDLRVDPTNPNHLIGSSKWIVSPEGYNHQLGFYESTDGGRHWNTQGHIPGFEGWTDDTDPVGAFDGFGNYYELHLAYQFFYNPDGSHNFGIGTQKEPNPAEPAEVVGVTVRPQGATSAADWITTRGGQPDFVATYDSIGNEPDKQWITIDANPSSPHYNRVYAMWVDFHNRVPVPFVSYADAQRDGTHTAWSKPQRLPVAPHSPQGVTYVLPHVAPDGTVYTTLTNFNPKKGYCCVTITVDGSTDGGVTWSVAGTAVPNVTPPGLIYPNTTFRDGIEDTFAVGNHANGKGLYPLYVSYEDASAGVDNVMLTASYDGGATWSDPIQVNDNQSAADEFQPNLNVAANGTVSVAFYDRRLSCPARGTSEAVGAGIALDQVNPNYSGTLPPYGATNYCVDASIEFYEPDLTPIGNNIRLTQNTWDPQLNSPHPGSPDGLETFIGDYFGNVSGDSTEYTSFVSTFNDGTNPNNQQQQVVAAVPLP